MFLPKRLVFSGGGTRCLVFLPALRILEARGHLTAVNEWWGTSAGSLCAALLAITRSATRVDEIMQGAEYVKFRDVSLMNMMNIQTAWGMDDGRGLLQEIEVVLEKAESGASRKTLSDVSGLHLVVADLNVYKSVVCSAANYPTLRVADAIRASMSLPIFYTPFRCPVDGHIWVDGGLRQGFPWECLPSDAARRESLGFAFERSWHGGGPTTFMEYIFSMVHFDDPVRTHKMKTAWAANILWFQTPPFPPWYVRLREDDFTILRTLGEAGAHAWLAATAATSTQRSSPGTGGSPLSSEDPSTPTRENPHGRDESSDNRPPFLHMSQDRPFRDSQSGRPRSSRRWSL
jgi:predicted acylesterase/phospholipase RssA